MTGDPLRRAGLLLLLTVVMAALLAGQAGAASVIANGNNPDAVVDRDGVTHVVWNESVSGGSDVLHYCQIPRGGTQCTNPQSFTPTASPINNNSDLDGPHVMVTPFGEVILLTFRCCGVIEGQANGSNGSNVIYVSDDGGQSFGPAHALSTNPPGAPAVPTPVIFDGAGRNLMTISAPTGGIRLQAAPVAQGAGTMQAYTTTVAQLSNYNSYDASVVQPTATTFVAAWTDAGGTKTAIRTLTCPALPCSSSYINTAANWTPEVSIPDAERPRLTTGPTGTFLMYRRTSDRHYLLRRVDGGSVGAPLPVSPGAAGFARDVVEDANGLLHTLYIDGANGLGYRASANGGAQFGDEQTLVPGPDFTIGNVRVTARTVDDGFTGAALWTSNSGGEQNPKILMQALPDPSVSLVVKPPPGSGPPGGQQPPVVVPPAACQTLSFAAIDVIADTCMTRKGTTVTATGGLRINGLRVELGGGRITFDTKARTVKTTGTVTIKAGDTVLFKDDINWTLPAGSIANIGTFSVSGGGDLLGFPLKGSASLKLRGGGAEIPVHLGLPALFGGVTGDVTIRADNVAGVHLRELHVKVGDALIGPLEIKDLTFDYDAEATSWAGGATLILPPQPPGPSLAGKIGFSKGNLDYLNNELTLPGPGIALDPFAATYLKKIRFSLATSPLRLSGGVTINAGPTIGGVAAVGVDGDLTFTLSDPAVLRADGRVSLVSIPVGSAYFELRMNGYVGFGGKLEYSVSGFGVSAQVDGWLFKTAFNVGAKASVCLGDLGCAGGEVVFSSTGFAGCAYTKLLDFGAGYKWGEGLDIMWSGCDVGPYKAVAAAAQAGGARSVTIGKGLRAAVIGVEGQGAPPHAALVGPGGAPRIDPPAAGKLETDAALAFHVPERNATFFVVKAPAAGTWTIEPAADSAPITAIKSADGLADPKVTARVRRASGGRRALSYTVNSVPGQKVTFAEQGKGAARTLGTAKGSSGTLRFTPVDGPGGTRKILALVSSYGRPRTQLTVASYVAPPPPRPATPKRLKGRRSGTRLVVTWATAANARRYQVRAALSDGRRILVRQKGTRLTIPAVAAATRATITVTGLKPDGTRGRSATLKVAAKKAKARKKSR